MRDYTGSSHGNGMNGHAAVAEAVLTERRLTRLEVGQDEHSRRVTALELGHATVLSRLEAIQQPKSSKGEQQPHLSRALLMQAASSAGMWMGSILAAAYVATGGNALTALKELAKLLPSG